MATFILYFSRKGYNYATETIQNVPAGNTKVAAQMSCNV